MLEDHGTGWGSAPKPPLYHAALAKSRELNQIASEASSTAWELDHALWVVRVAENAEEKAIALSHLAEKMAKYNTLKAEAA